jgi:hypothetical protein
MATTTWLATAVATMVMACGGATGGEGDGGTTTADAAIDAARCDPSAVFGTPVEVSINTTSHEWTGRPFAGGREVFFSSAPGTGNDLFHATRASVDEPFGLPEALETLNAAPGASQQLSPQLTADGRTIYFQSGDSRAWDIFVATRSSLVDGFGMPVRVANVNGETDSDSTPFPNADGSSLYFSSSRNGGINRADLDGTGAFGEPVLLGELHVTTEWSPVLTTDELTIVFSRDSDIWTARRSTKADDFVEIRKLTELSTAAEDYPMWISDDLCELWFMSSGIPGATGGADLFVARRPGP